MMKYQWDVVKKIRMVNGKQNIFSISQIFLARNYRYGDLIILFILRGLSYDEKNDGLSKVFVIKEQRKGWI